LAIGLCDGWCMFVDVIFEQVKLEWHVRIREFCKLPYPRHPNGCPMYGTRLGCPPEAPMIGEILDLSEPTYLVAIKYNVKEHYDKLRAEHPNLSEAQIRIPYLWQGRADKLLREAVEACKREVPNKLPVYRPEANGVNVVAMMGKLGFVLKFPTEEYAYRVAVLGSRKKGKLGEAFRR